MKIWILTSETAEVVGGGIGHYVENMSRALARGGHEVRVICCGPRAEVREIENGLEFHYVQASYHSGVPRKAGEPRSRHPAFPYNTLHYWIALSWQMARVVADLVASEGPPDVIECQEHNGLGYYLLERRLQHPGFLDGVPVVLHLHSPDFILERVNERSLYRLPDYWRGWMERQCIHRADGIVCPSQYLSSQVAGSLNGQHPPIRIFPLPHEPDYGPCIERKAAQGIPTVLYIGRLEKRKGVLETVAGAALLWEAGRRFKMILVGADEPLETGERTVWSVVKERHKKWIEDGRLVRKERMPHQELGRLRASADVVLVPSLWENFPNTAMEAMLAGCTLLVSDAGGQAEMLGEAGKAGLVFSWGKAGDFGEKLNFLLEMTAPERRAMGKRARTRVRELCDPLKIASARVAHYEELVSAWKGPASYPFLKAPGEPDDLVFGNHRVGDLTVVIPHYNQGAYLLEALDSVMQSAFAPRRILVVDDGSTEEDSRRVLREIADRGISHLEVVRCPHRGLPAARNTGAHMAATPLVAFVDADDVLGPEFLERCVGLITAYPNIALVYSWMQYFGESHEVYPCWDLSFPYLLVNNQLIPACVVRRQAFLDHARHRDCLGAGFEDWDSWISLLKRGGRGVAIAEPLARYRVREGSMLRRLSPEARAILKERIVLEHGELYREHGDAVAGLLSSNPEEDIWHHPGKWTEWGPPEKQSALRAWFRLTRSLKALERHARRAFLKGALRLQRLKGRLGR